MAKNNKHRKESADTVLTAETKGKRCYNNVNKLGSYLQRKVLHRLLHIRKCLGMRGGYSGKNSRVLVRRCSQPSWLALPVADLILKPFVVLREDRLDKADGSSPCTIFPQTNEKWTPFLPWLACLGLPFFPQMNVEHCFSSLNILAPFNFA